MAAPKSPAQLFDLSGQVALVTGASEGLGWAMAQTLAAAGAHVVITGRREAMLREKLAQLHLWGLSADTMAVDAADSKATKAAVAGLASRHGQLDIVISNTAAGIRKPFLEMEEAEWQSVMDGGLSAGWRLARQTAPIMAEAGYGRIVLISSINATLARPGISAYVTAKTALHGLVRALAVELAPVGVTVNALAPGYFLTNGNVGLRTAQPDFHDKIAARTPAARWGDPQELGTAALYLASRASSYTTGSVVTVDGGLTATI